MTFSQLNLTTSLLKAVKEAGYETPSPIQEKAIPPVLAGHDLLGCAQTGTGKTAAFALPILQTLAAHRPNHKSIRALILTPTRELALQIGESFAQYGKYTTVTHTVIFGGVGQQPQVDTLKRGVDILVACPGRLNDLIGQGYVSLDKVEIFVLDEADRMLDMGFVHDVKKVIAKLPRQRQNLMFSATMPKEIEELAAGILQNPVSVKVDPVSSTVERIDQSLYFVSKANKKQLLPYLIRQLGVKNALVFSRTKHGANRIADDLTKAGIPAAAIHGNKSQSARVAALEGFKAGKMQVLVATDIAARGIDINELSHVFNYDLPEVPETYVHRIGRTARAGADGAAISFCCPDELEYLAGIEKLNRKKIPVVRDHPWAEGGNAPRQPVPSQPKEEPVEPNKPAKQNQRPQGQKSLSGSSRHGRRRRENQQQEAAARNAAPSLPQQPGQNCSPARTAPVQKPTVRQDANRPASEKKQPQPERTRPQAEKPKATQPQPQPKRNNNNNKPRNTPNAAHAAAERQRMEALDRAMQPRRPHEPLDLPTGKNEDVGLVLISRKPPVQKFSSFEEYMAAHGGETAPITGWEESDE